MPYCWMTKYNLIKLYCFQKIINKFLNLKTKWLSQPRYFQEILANVSSVLENPSDFLTTNGISTGQNCVFVDVSKLTQTVRYYK